MDKAIRFHWIRWDNFEKTVHMRFVVEPDGEGMGGYEETVKLTKDKFLELVDLGNLKKHLQGTAPTP